MRQLAFKLVAAVVGMQLLIAAFVIAGCFTTDKECDGKNITEFMSFITTQAFALYAAEKN